MSDTKKTLVVSLWSFFASIKLALFVLTTLAATAVIGTVIPQQEGVSWYVQEYGAKWARLIELFDIADMYSSWWFLLLLGMLCTNLIVCSVERFPAVWQQVRADNLGIRPERLAGMKRKKEWQAVQDLSGTVSGLEKVLASRGWKAKKKSVEEGTLFFAQKGAWSRTGVYLVHTSILIIFLGAIVGELFGFKGNVMLPESAQTDRMYSLDGSEFIGFGFAVRCDAFAISYYPNKMVKSYRSLLTVIDGGQEVLQAPVEVNAPLTYKGVTFYQSSYEGYQEFLFTLRETQSNTGKTLVLPFQEEVEWEEQGLRLGVVSVELGAEEVSRIKVWLSDGSADPSLFWMDAGSEVKVDQGGKSYLVSGKQLFATGLQVCKDPGVGVVYLGCGLLLLGLLVAFFSSHRRIWLLIREEKGQVIVLVAGSANKNRSGFDRDFETLVRGLRESGRQ